MMLFKILGGIVATYFVIGVPFGVWAGSKVLFDPSLSLSQDKKVLLEAPIKALGGLLFYIIGLLFWPAFAGEKFIKL